LYFIGAAFFIKRINVICSGLATIAHKFVFLFFSASLFDFSNVPILYQIGDGVRMGTACVGMWWYYRSSSDHGTDY